MFEEIRDSHNVYLDLAFKGAVKSICLELNRDEEFTFDQIKAYLKLKLDLELESFKKDWVGEDE
jgi:type II secretory pathway component PulL